MLKSFVDVAVVDKQQHSPETTKPRQNNCERSNAVQTVNAITTSQANECTPLELVLPSPSPQSLRESPLLLFDCLRLIPRGDFMTMQPQKCCGVHREEGNSETVQEEAQLETRPQRGQPSDHHVATEMVTLHSRSFSLS